MKNRFNLITEEEKSRIMNLHKKHSVIKEQKNVQKITEEEFNTLKAAAQKFMDDKFFGKTVNLYTHDHSKTSGFNRSPETYEDSPMGPWKIKKIEFTSDGLYDFYPEGGNRLEVSIGFEVIAMSEEEERETTFTRAVENSRDNGFLETTWYCGLLDDGSGFSDDYFWNQNNLTGGKKEVESFTNGPLIADLSSVCDADNAFTEFNNLFEGKWKMIISGTDYGMGDEEIDVDVTLAEEISRNKEIMEVITEQNWESSLDGWDIQKDAKDEGKYCEDNSIGGIEYFEGQYCVVESNWYDWETTMGTQKEGRSHHGKWQCGVGCVIPKGESGRYGN